MGITYVILEPLFGTSSHTMDLSRERLFNHESVHTTVCCNPIGLLISRVELNYFIVANVEVSLRSIVPLPSTKLELSQVSFETAEAVNYLILGCDSHRTSSCV